MNFEPRNEVLDRVRRIETRLTKLLTHFGISPGAERPSWESGVVRVPSRRAQLEDILSVVPHGYGKEEFDVYVGEDYLCSMFVDR